MTKYACDANSLGSLEIVGIVVGALIGVGLIAFVVNRYCGVPSMCKSKTKKETTTTTTTIT